MLARAYHEPQGNPCRVCGLAAHRHWVRHPVGCDCGASHRSSVREQDTRGYRDRKYWVGLDGEGIGRKPHRYVYLAYSDAEGSHTDSIRDNSGLRTSACFEFLLSLPTDARVAGFYLGYDWTMIMRDMPKRAIYELLRPELRHMPSDEGSYLRPVRWRDYKINYQARTVRIKRKDRSVTIWDVGPFFQSSFVKALEAWGIGKDHIETIRRMKDKRSQFTEDDDIETYCLKECALLAKLTTELDEAHKDAGLPLRSWHGPGATANMALKKMGIREKRGIIPRPVQQLALHAFFGGRFEHATVGKVGDVFGYDIVSAYPYETYNLPCLEHAIWERTTDIRAIESNPQALVSFQVDDCGEQYWGPLPCRMRDGTIVWARGGFTGHCWGQEYLEASKAWKGIRFQDAWVLKRDCNCIPFAMVLEWFRERERIGKDGKGKALKLVLNSIYGKLAQSVGRPQYRSIIWAGMITSGTRTRLLNIIAQNPYNVVATATDGLSTREPITIGDAPLAGERLGSWEEKRHPNMILVRPGIYWSDDQLKARGLGNKQLKSYRSRVMYAIAKDLPEAKAGKAPIFMGARQSVYKTQKGQVKRHPLYGEWIERPVRIRLTPLPKRNPDWSLRMLDNVESQPYGRKSSQDASIMQELENLMWGQPA
jgi:DNA polymerase family B